MMNPNTSSSGAPVLAGCEEPLDTVYDAALLDLDGVVYIGPEVVPAAPEAIGKARAEGMRVAFVTNNAARTPAAIAEILTRMDVAAEARDVVTSPQAAARVLTERFAAGSPVLVVGDTGLRQAVHEAGLRPVTVAREDPVAVVQGYHPRLDYGLISEGALAVAAGALFVVTNADTTAPMARGVMPANGSFARVIATATGQEPVVAGKPMRPLHEEGVLRARAERPLVVGDRLDTDIEGATRRSAASLLVLSGVTTPERLIAAAPEHRPSYLGWNIAAMGTAHPGVVTGADGASCGGWHAAVRGGRLELTGAGDRLDGLRALCGAAWSGVEGADQAAPGPALAQLGW